MQEPKPHTDEPFILNIRMSGRLVPFAVMVLLFALLPFLGGSSTSSSGRVVLAAGAPGAPDQGGSAMPAAPSAATNAAATTVGAAMGAAMGGGLFMFPDVAFNPVVGQSITAAGLTTPRLGGPQFIFPVNGQEVSAFGPRIHPVLGRPMFHTGIDLSAGCGTPIRAAAAGRVVYARVSPSWGLRTIIQHTPGLKTAYGHQSAFFVKDGDVVRQGQVIGLVGTTGWSTGCHLHFDVIVNDRYVDPGPYLGLPGSRADSIPFAASPHFVSGQGAMIRTVEDGDVPVPVYSTGGSTTTTGGTSTSPTSPQPTTGSSTSTSTSPSTSTTTSPATSTSTSTSPSTSTSTGTTTTTPTETTTTTSEPSTSTAPETTTTSEPAPTSDTSTTSEPAPTSDTSTTSDSSTTPDPAPAQNLESTTAGIVETSTEIGTATDPESTPAAEPTSTTADITTTSQP